MDQTDGGGRLVDVLAACAGGAVDLHLDVGGVDFNVDVVVQLGHDLKAGETGLAAGVGVKRADAHQTVDAVLALEHAVGVGALDHHRRGLDAGLVAVQHVEHLDAVAVGLGPAGVHAVEHLGPVLGLGAAGTGVEGQDGVVVVVLAVEHRHELQLVDGLLDTVDSLLTLGGQGRVVLLLDHEQQRLGLLILGGQLAEALELVLDLAHLADDLLAAGLVIVEAGHRHLVLQLGQALFAGLDGQCVAQVIHGGLHAAELCFQFVNRNHISFPSSHISWHKIT